MDYRDNYLLNIVYGLLNFYKEKIIKEKKDISAKESLYTIGEVVGSDFILLSQIADKSENVYEFHPVKDFCFKMSEPSINERIISSEKFCLPFLRSYSYYKKDIPRQLQKFGINFILASTEVKIYEVNSKYNRYKLGKKSYCVLFGWNKKLSNKKRLEIDEKFSIALIDFISQVTELLLNMNIFDEMRRDWTLLNLEESERKYENLFENSIDAVCLANQEWIITEANDKALELFGIKREELRNIKFSQFLADIKDWQKLLDELDEFGPIRGQEIKLKLKNGKEMSCLFSLSPLKTKLDKILGYQGILRDITFQKQFQRKVKERIIDQQDIYLKTVEIISKTYEMKIPFKIGHHRRVTDFACAIAKELELSTESVSAISIAGAIHDIGEAYLPSGLTAKPYKLKEYEYDLVKMHPKIGFEIVKEINFPDMVCDIIKQHHERLDGSGYPEGLNDNNIRKESKILAVADVFDALLSERPYRLGYDVENAKDEIFKMKDSLYDDSIGKAFDKVMENKQLFF